MRRLGTILLLLLIMSWGQAAQAEYCERNPDTNQISCKFIERHGKPHNAMISFTLTREGYSMMITIFVKEWLMLGGDTTVKIGDAEPIAVEYKGTRRDITEQGLLMEATVFLVPKDLLENIHRSKGNIYFNIATEDSGELEVKFWSRRFKKLGDFIDETQAILNPGA